MNILIFTASTGGGHKRAAAAIEAKIHTVSPDDNVYVVDAMKEVGRAYDKTVCGGYHFMATKIPKVYGVSYKITDRKSLVYKAVTKCNTLMAKKLLQSINEYAPDVIIACHPFVSTMVSGLKGKGYISNIKTISLITDYDSHRTYICPNIDAYVVAEPHMADKLVEKYNVSRDKIYPLGIPIFDSFASADIDKKEICTREGLDPEKPTVLLMAGSFGVTSVLEFYKHLALKGKGLQFIVITGRNQKLYDNLEKLISELGTQDNTKLLFFVDNVQDYMHVSDLIVTKPGGLTVTESLACHLPLAIYSAYPGQELDNAVFLTEQNAAILVGQKNGADDIISLLGNEEKLEKMKEICKKLAQPDSAENIFRLCQKICGEN